MPGITIIPGTAWPVRPLVEATRPMVWPQARKSLAKRVPDQFQPRWVDDGAISLINPEYDESAIVLGPVQIWPGNKTQSGADPVYFYFSAKHTISMALDWLDGLPDVTVRVRGQSAGTTAAAGMTPLDTAVGVNLGPNTVSTAEFEQYSPQLHGVDHTTSAQSIVGDFLFGLWQMQLTRTAANAIVFEIAVGGGAAFLGFYITPQITTTHQIRDYADSNIVTPTNRSIRLTYDETAMMWGLLVPDGFLWSTYVPAP